MIQDAVQSFEKLLCVYVCVSFKESLKFKESRLKSEASVAQET